MPLSQALVRELLDYDTKTGVLTWRHRAKHWFQSLNSFGMWNTRYAGQPAGSLCKRRRYIVVKLLGKAYQAHRIAFLWQNGYLPAFIDHESGVRHFNAEHNLKPATRKTNSKNKKVYANSTSGVSGVRLAASGKWQARIGEGGRKSLGYYTSFDDAVAARKAAERADGYHPNHGRS